MLEEELYEQMQRERRKQAPQSILEHERNWQKKKSS